MENTIEDLLRLGNIKEGTNIFRSMEKKERLHTIRGLKGIKDERLAEFLNAVHEGEVDKEVKKEIRRLLFILKTSGVRVEEPKRDETPVLKRIEESKEHMAFLSNYDYASIRVIECAFQIKRGTYLFITAFTHFSHGLKEFFMGELKRSDVDDLLKQFMETKPENVKIVRISPAYALFILEEASTISGKKRSEINLLKKRFRDIPSDVKTPEDIYTLNIPEGIHPFPIERILKHEVFTHTQINWEHMDKDADEYRDPKASSLLLPPYLVEEKREAIIKRIKESEEIKSNIKHIKRLFEDYAYMFYLEGDYSHYKGLIGYLLWQESMDAAIDYFVKKSLHHEEEKEKGLIVNPYG